MTAEASFISLAAVIVIFGLIWVSPTVSVVPVEFDENVQRNVKRYRKALPDGGWKLLDAPADIYMVCSILLEPSMISFQSCDSCVSFLTISCKPWVVFSMFDGLTTGSSRWALIAQHKALFNKSVNSGSPCLLSYASLVFRFSGH